MAIDVNEKITRQEEIEVVEGMRVYGGSFFKALSAAIIRADMENLRKIKSTWPDKWQQYREMGQRRLQGEAAPFDDDDG